MNKRFRETPYQVKAQPRNNWRKGQTMLTEQDKATIREAREKGWSYKRIARAGRRAKYWGGLRGPVDPLAILERDGWRCQLCGCKTPKSKRGTYASNAPEVDHIVPLVKGGSHLEYNLQCACRHCNGEKGARAIGQLRLAI